MPDRESGQTVNLKRADVALLVVRPDDTGDLWVDAAAVALQIMAKRNMAAGTVVFENDIADVTGMGFPLVAIGKRDRVVCVFREGWRFALFFDFNPGGDFSVSDMQRDLGTLYRRLAQAHFAGKERLLRSALKSFAERDAIPVLKIALNEIEGILGDAYRKVYPAKSPTRLATT